MMTPRLSRRRLVPWSFAVAAVIASCNLHNQGVSPPEAALSFPSALALSRESQPRFLYVANANFDLRYNAGSVQSYDLDRLDAVIKKCRAYGNVTLDAAGNKLADAGATRLYADNTRTPVSGLIDASVRDAGDVGDAGDAGSAADAGSLDGGGFSLPENYGLTAAYGNARGVLCDGRDRANLGLEDCCFDSEEKLNFIRRSAIEIDSFAAGLAVGDAVLPHDGAPTITPAGGGAPVAASYNRLYVPVASRNTLVYLDSVNGELSCGEGSGRCRRGPNDKSQDDDPDHKFPGQLSSIAIGKLGDLLPAGQDFGADRAATYVATTHELGGFSLFLERDGAPVLESVLGELGRRPRSVTADPDSNLLYVTSAGDPYVSRIGVRVNPSPAISADEPPPSVDPQLGTNDPRKVLEEGPREILYESSRIIVSGVSQPGDLRDLAVEPKNLNRLYALVRGTQEAVAFLEVDPTLAASNARLIDAVRIDAGPSKLIRIVQDGKVFLLASCYDGKSVFVIDAETRLLVSVVRSFSGPFSMVYDEKRKLLHVADFRASIMRVVDLAGLTDKTEPPPRIVATIGSPQFEGGLQ
jgi:DNA-binding beta-propeller fold protein YncE